MLRSIGKRIAQARTEAGFARQADLAKAIATSATTISRYERGDITPPHRALVAIAQATGRTVAWLLGEELTTGEQEAGVTQAIDQIESLLARAQAVVTPLGPAGMYPGIRALLADEHLCSTLAITPAEITTLRAYHLPVGPADKAQAIALLLALRAMTASPGSAPTK